MRKILLGIILGVFAFSANAQVIVKTFHDANNNGKKDSKEELVGGMVVYAVDSSGVRKVFNEVNPGIHTLSTTQEVRIEVTGYKGDYTEGVSGITSVFFAKPNESFDVPLSTGATIDATTTDIILPCYDAGPAEFQDGPSIIRFPLMADGVAKKYDGDAPNPTMVASVKQVGSAWGVGMVPSKNRMYASAVLKRHVGLGPMRAGGIYEVNLDGNILESFNLNGVTPAVGPTIDLGTVTRKNVQTSIAHDGSDDYTLTSADQVATYDIDAFDKVGKMAFGDIDVTEDEQQLWMVNLKQRSLIQGDISGDHLDMSSLKHYIIEDLPGLPSMMGVFERNFNAGGQDAGGAESFVDHNGLTWERSKYMSGEAVWKYNKTAVADVMKDLTSEEQLYQTYYEGKSFKYSIPVPSNDEYEVIFHFQEPQYRSENRRKFNVTVEGGVALQDLDIYSIAGGTNRALAIKTTATVTDGMLNIEFDATLGSAIICGIQVHGKKEMMTGVLRPWSIQFHHGKGFIGLVNDASVSKSKDHLKGYILTFDPNNVEAGFNSVLEFPLNYPREHVSKANSNLPQASRTSSWEAWIDIWEDTGISTKNDEVLFLSYPQPIISDISHDADGNMVIGLMDRWAHQVGYRNYPSLSGDKTYIIGYSAGDILKACKQDGEYILECDAKDDGPFRRDDGPSMRGEFFSNDYFLAERANHGEIFTGGLGILPTTMEAVNTVFNPIRVLDNPNFDNEGVYSQGIHVYNTETGDKERAYLFIDQYSNGKANGLGDIEFAMSLAGAEVGNYVWCDTNGDGIMNPYEPGIAGVKLTLHDKANNKQLVDMTTTDENGRYLFTGLKTNHKYEIRLDLSQETLAKLSKRLSPKDQVDPTASNSDLVDSDADGEQLPGFGVIMAMTQGPGSVDHSYDFGLLGPAALTAERVLCEDGVGSGKATFALDDDLKHAIDTTMMNDVSFHTTLEGAHNDSDEITTATYMSQTGMIWARVSIIGEHSCYSVAKVNLIVNPSNTTGPTFTSTICNDTPIDLTELVDLGQDISELNLFESDCNNEVGSPDAYVPTTLPTELCYKVSLFEGCTIEGKILLNSFPLPSVSLGRDTSICDNKFVNLDLFDGKIETNGVDIKDVMWQTKGDGTFDASPRYGEALRYEFGTQDTTDGYVILKLAILDHPCVDNISDSVRLDIISPKLVVDCLPADTVSCMDPRLADLRSPDFPAPSAYFCENEAKKLLLNVTKVPLECNEEVVARYVREWKFYYKGSSATCNDTIYVKGLPMEDIVCPPQMDTVYCKQYMLDENGYPHPKETGIPKIDTIELWPQLPILCKYEINYKDEPFGDICGGSKIFKREWFIFNKCTGEKKFCEQWITILDTLGPDIKLDLTHKYNKELDVVEVNTDSHKCEGYYYPSARVIDSCSNVKLVKARVAGYGAVAMELVDAEKGLYRAREAITLKKSSTPLEIVIEAVDFCHNKSMDTIRVKVKDRIKPVVVLNRNINVSLGDKKVWVDAAEFDEGSWDNCGVNLVLARRMDWADFCMDLCNDKIGKISKPSDLCKYDPFSVLGDGRGDVHTEKGYLHSIEWLAQDGEDCGQLMVDAWKAAIMSEWSSKCAATDDHGNPIFNDNNIKACLGLGDTQEDVEHFKNLKRIGGGWAKQVPFSCEDACKQVKVEVLVMDNWCNWSKSWLNVNVEDNVPPTLLKKLDDVTINCDALKAEGYSDIINEAIKHQFSSVNQEAFDRLDQALGGYTISWRDAQGNPTKMDGTPFETMGKYYTSTCETTQVTDKVADTLHDGTVVWRYVKRDSVYSKRGENKFCLGFIGVNCSATIEQDIWPFLDDCGQGYIIRNFHVSTGCNDIHKNKTTYTQRINITPSCDLTKAMFDVPKDVTVCVPSLTYTSDNNVDLPLNEVGEATYKFDLGCRMIGIGYKDKVLKLSDPNQFKVIRTWYLSDWCTKIDYDCEQKIIVKVGCDDGDVSRARISGTVKDQLGNYIHNVDVHLTDMKGESIIDNSAPAGKYSIYVALNDRAKLNLSKNTDHVNGVSTRDILFIQRYLLGKVKLSSNQQKAADVNEDGKINALDMVALKRLVLGKTNVLPTDSWKFFDTKGNTSATIGMTSSRHEVDFVGIKMGDVSLDADYSRNTTTYPLAIVDQDIQSGNTYDIPVRVVNEGALYGLQLELDLSSDFASDVEIVGSSLDLDTNRKLDGAKVIWTPKQAKTITAASNIVTIRFVAKKDGKLSDVITLGSGMSSEAYLTSGLDVANIKIDFISNPDAERLQVASSPNPFMASTNISVQLPKAQHANVKIYDAQSRLILNKEIQGQAGHNEVTITRDELGVAGLYYFQVETDSKTSKMKKLILVE